MLRAISPMIVWAACFVTVYALQGIGCDRGWPAGVLTGALLALTAVALGGVAALGTRAWSRRTRFDARVTGVLAVIAAVALVYTALPVALLEPCAR